MHSLLTYITLLLYGLTTILWLTFLATLKKPVVRFAKGMLLVTITVHLAAIGWHHYNHLPPPILHPYSLLNLAAFLLALVYIISSTFADIDLIGAFLVPVITVVLLATVSEQLSPAINATPKAFITPVHIGCSVISFVGFTISFFASIMYAIQDFSIKIRRHPIRLPALNSLERLAFKSVILSFPIYTLAIVLGTLWAVGNKVSYLGSPQYIAGVISWWIYAVVLYGYIGFGWRGRRAMALTVAAYAGVATLALYYVLKMWRQM